MSSQGPQQGPQQGASQEGWAPVVLQRSWRVQVLRLPLEGAHLAQGVTLRLELRGEQVEVEAKGERPALSHPQRG